MSVIKYFAYGSNMFAKRLLTRCSSAKAIGVYKLNGYEFRYSKESISKHGNSAKANIVTKAGSSVIGVVFEIDELELRELRDAEGCNPDDGSRKQDKGYTEQEVNVVSLTEERSISAKAYISPSDSCKIEPFDWYIKHVVEGAKAFNVDDKYIEHYLDVPSIIDKYEKRKTDEFAYHSQ